jgi:hypothetical protein
MTREISSKSTSDRQIWKLREMTQTEERILEPDIIAITQAVRPKLVIGVVAIGRLEDRSLTI